MNNNPLSDVPAVRLASGIEPQQKWPMVDKPTRSNEAPKLIEFSPSFGNEGTIITVVLQALPPQMPVKLAFNSLMVDTKQLQAQGITSLVATVPSFQQTHSSTPNVPISVCFFDKDMVTETWMVAEFTFDFTNEKTTTATTTAPGTPTVAAAATSTATDTAPTTPYHDPISNMANNFPKDNNDFYHNLYSQPGQYNFGTQVPGYQQYAYQQNQRDMLMDRYNQQGRPQQLQTNQYNGYSHSALNFFSPSGNATGFTNMLTGNLDNSSPSTPTYSQPRRHQSGSTVFGFKSTTHTPTTSVANYQPYPGLVSRANLDIAGDLDSMTKTWTSDEWNNRRRLVQFWREQNSNKITTTFQPVPQGERATNSGNIVVSCIYWMERNDFFITSVDCIYLLECLMDIRFSVEEKNRIRRNLEGFRPLTVSKCKAESAEFFKLIMSFPNPKPRNIEKDVKVFPWKTLPYALKKIVTKYTASSYSNISTSSQKMNQQANERSSNASTTASTPIVRSPQTPHIENFYSNNSSTYATPTYHLYDQTSYFDQKQQVKKEESFLETTNQQESNEQQKSPVQSSS